MSRGDGGDFRGPLAGAGAGAMAVLITVPLLFWMVWHRVQGAAGTAVLVMIGSVAAVVVAGALYVIGCLVVRMRMHVQHPETLLRARVRAEMLPPPQPVLGEVHHVEIPRPAPSALEAGTRYGWPQPAREREDR